MRHVSTVAYLLLAMSTIGCNSADDLVDRGVQKLVREGDPDGAIEDFTAAIRKDPNCGDAFVNRGCAYRTQSRYQDAMNDYNEAIRVAPDLAFAYVCRAWILAAAPDDSLRDGERAVADVRRAAEIESKPLEEYADCAAAAFAEKGDFAAAVKLQQIGIQNLSSVSDPSRAEQRLRDYRSGKPYRLMDGF